MLYYVKTVNQTLKELAVSKHGLSVIEAAERLDRYGLNAVKVIGKPLWRKLIEPFASVFMVVLFIAAVISLVQGAIIDAAIIMVIIATSVIIYYVQLYSTGRIIRSLQKHTALKVDTLRDNKTIELDSSQLVPGDIISLREGNKIPADARIISAHSLRVDESQLTGESEPITKQVDRLDGDKEVYEQSNILFQGSFIVGGETIAVVVATGNDTEFGQLAVLTTDATHISPVQVKIDKLVGQIISVIMGIAVVAFALSLYRGVSIVDSVRFIIALSVSAVPEGLPVAISVVLALGMRRMAVKNALVRTMRAIETIGIVTTIATDKTGTLTKNKLSVQQTWQLGGTADEFKICIARATNDYIGRVHDPLDVALSNFSQVQFRQMPIVIFPFDQLVSMSGNLWHNGSDFDAYIKGSPENLLERASLTARQREDAHRQLHKMTSSGYRVIAFGHVRTTFQLTSLDELSGAGKLKFDGFVAVADVLRPDAKAAIKTAIEAGITVRMITGDHFETAYHIGRKLGMVTSKDQVFDSRRMRVMSDVELAAVIENVRVFSRVIPEHKHRILAILNQHNITAMTGDGVNDVPALTNAHVGIAMGSGSSIAKDAGDIILINDSFKSIVDAIHEGRTIYANIKRMLMYLLSTNAGEVLVALGALAVGMPIPLVPVQILWVNLVTDTLLVIPLGLEPGELRNMRRAPQKPDAPLLSRFMITRIILIALTIAGLTLVIYVYYSSRYDIAYGRTAAFCALVVMQWASAFCGRSDYEPLWIRFRRWNGSFYAGLSIAVVLQMLAILGPWGRFLHVTPIMVGDILIVSLIGFIGPIIMIESHKFIGRRFFNKGSQALVDHLK